MCWMDRLMNVMTFNAAMAAVVLTLAAQAPVGAVF